MRATLAALTPIIRRKRRTARLNHARLGSANRSIQLARCFWFDLWAKLPVERHLSAFRTPQSWLAGLLLSS